ARRRPLAGRHRARSGLFTAGAPGDCLRWRRCDGIGCRARTRVHERTGAHRWRAPQRRELAVHARGVHGRIPRGPARTAGMDMIAPFFDYGYLGAQAALVAALVIGIAFGWCLESAGMGSARKLAGQFYLTDLTVFKV